MVVPGGLKVFLAPVQLAEKEKSSAGRVDVP